MHYCGMTEDKAMFELPFVRGLQYIHAALLSQGAHCTKPDAVKEKFDCLLGEHAAIIESYQQNQDLNEY